MKDEYSLVILDDIEVFIDDEEQERKITKVLILFF